MNTNEMTTEAVQLLQRSEPLQPGKESIALISKALHKFQQAGDVIGVSKAYATLGNIYVNSSNVPDALEAFGKAIELQRRIPDIIGTGLTMLNMSVCYSLNGNHAQALYHAQESIRILSSGVESMNSETPIGQYVYVDGNWIMHTKRNHEFLANAYINYGNTLRSLGELDQAIKTYRLADATADGIDNLHCRAITANQLGDVLLETGNYQQALESFQRAYDLFVQLEKKGYAFAVVCQSLGEVYLAQNKEQTAKEYLDLALREFKNSNSIVGQIDIHYHTAELHARQKHWKIAQKSYAKALQMAQSISSIEQVVRAMRGTGKVAAHTNAKNAYSHLTQALLLAEEHGLKKEEMQIHKELSVYYKMYGDAARALFHYEQYHAIRDAVISERTERQLSNLKILHEVEAYKKQIAEKEQKLILLEQELDSKTRELNALALHIIEKKDFMEIVANGLRKVIAAHPSDKDYYAHALLESLDIENTTKKAWKEFAEQFMTVHRTFIEKLLHLCPLLSPSELRVCVLLRMSLNSKQIAEIMHLSLRSVENHRLHIRKKLSLDDKSNLSGYIISLE